MWPTLQRAAAGFSPQVRGMGNIMYKINPAFTWAWEYRRLLTDFRNQPTAGERGDQVNMAIAYMF